MKKKFSPKVIHGIILFLIFCISLLIRVYLPYDKVFADDWVRFAEMDPWYHMRLVDNLLQHFPQHISFDPYAAYPLGVTVFFPPFFDLFLASVIWITGLGSPSQHTADTVAAYFPAILGALMTIPLYFIGKELFNRNAGLISAALIAILPGDFLVRSLLGWTDHHILESLLTTLTMLFLILALKRAREREPSFRHLAEREWATIKKPLLHALLSGIVLGLYVLSWVAAPFLVFILILCFTVQFIVDHLKGQSTDYLCLIGAPVFLIAFVMGVVFLPQGIFTRSLTLFSLAIAGLTILALSGISRFTKARNVKPIYYPLVLVGLGVMGVVLFYVLPGSPVNLTLWFLDSFLHPGEKLSILEVRPLLSNGGILPSSAVWHNFTTGLFIAFVSFGLLIRSLVRERNPEKTLFITWSILMLAITLLGQRRFAYYSAVNIALLSGYFCARLLEWIGSWRVKAAPEASLKKKREKGKQSKIRKTPEKEPSLVILVARHSSAVILVFFLALYPNIGLVIGDAQRGSGPSDDWHDSLLWMRDNTPDPFQEPGFYYDLYEALPAGKGYDYPPSAYGVMSWWDYGHWITRIAHRMPNANPFQRGAHEAAHFFTAQDEASAAEILKRMGTKYVVIDYAMARTKFDAMAVWAGKDPTQFSEPYYRRTSEGQLRPVTLYYPAYYQSLCSRLYNFRGKAVEPDNTTRVISYEEKRDKRGRSYKEITSAEQFHTHDEAMTYLETVDSPNYRLVGHDPFASPVPLGELEHYKLLHCSGTVVAQRGENTVSLVEIFEYFE